MKSASLRLCAFALMLGSAAAAPKTNVVVILADDLGYGDLSSYGHPKFKTPRIDRLAAEGVRFTHFYSPCPYCAPSRAALLTGRFPLRCGVPGNPAPGEGKADKAGLPPEEVTLAELFRDAGYATAMVGKWHLGHQPHLLPTRQGFASYFGIPYSNDMHPVKLLENEATVEYPVVQTTLTPRYTDRAVEFIAKNRDKPFFLYFAHAVPHKPLACSEERYRKSGGGLYGDVMAEMDVSVGRVLDALDTAGVAGRTIVVFTSDNGAWYGGSTGGLRGMKGLTWEGGVRVPCIVRWTGKDAPTGRTCAVPGFLGDVFSTVLAAAGVAPPADRVIDGRDLRPAAAGEAASIHDAIYLADKGVVQTVRKGNWKLHRKPEPQRRHTGEWKDPRAPDGVTLLAPFEQYGPDAYPGLLSEEPSEPWSLYDLEKDPGESRNVAQAHPEVVKELRGLLEAYEAEVGAAGTRR